MSGSLWRRAAVPFLVGAALAGALFIAWNGWSARRSRTADPVVEEAADPAAGRRTAIVRAVERVAPSVVSITAFERRHAMVSRSPVEEFLRNQITPDSDFSLTDAVPSFGSGIVLDSRGYFITNDHLVGNAESIWITTAEGDQYEAEVVGTDPTYDLSVVRVREQGEPIFETAPLGNSDDLMVGEWAVALGNPYSDLLGDPRPSVTAGVISALNREVKISDGSAIYKNMIQTDASINPGNSGGPLINIKGEVVGINTFVFTQGGGSLGFGFAIPINVAIELAGEILLYGKVRGVWTGIAVKGLQELPRYVLNYLEVTDYRGVVVWTLERGSPAEQAGIRLGDIIRAVDGQPVRDGEEARLAIFGARIGDTISFTVERQGESIVIPVTLEALPQDQARRRLP